MPTTPAMHTPAKTLLATSHARRSVSALTACGRNSHRAGRNDDSACRRPPPHDWTNEAARYTVQRPARAAPFPLRHRRFHCGASDSSGSSSRISTRRSMRGLTAPIHTDGSFEPPRRRLDYPTRSHGPTCSHGAWPPAPSVLRQHPATSGLRVREDRTGCGVRSRSAGLMMGQAFSLEPRWKRSTGARGMVSRLLAAPSRGAAGHSAGHGLR